MCVHKTRTAFFSSVNSSSPVSSQRGPLPFFGRFSAAVDVPLRSQHDDPTHPLYRTGWVHQLNWAESAVGADQNGTTTWVFEYDTSNYLFSRYLQATFDVLTDMVIEKAVTDDELIAGMILHLLYEMFVSVRRPFLGSRWRALGD